MASGGATPEASEPGATPVEPSAGADPAGAEGGRGGFPDRAERVLILAMIGSILVIALSPRVLWMYQAGLGLLISATFLQIAVGNVPKHFGFAASVRRILLILGIVVLVFGAGIVLVPLLSGLGT